MNETEIKQQGIPKMKERKTRKRTKINTDDLFQELIRKMIE
jgi:hypothetical protein